MTDTQLRAFTHRGRSLFVLALFILAVPGVVVAAPAPGNPSPDSSTAVLCSLEDSFSAIAQRVEPGVVSITSVQRVTSGSSDDESGDLSDFLKNLFKGAYAHPVCSPQMNWLLAQDRDTQSVTAEGSGTIVRRQGDKYYVLTNYHVVEDAYRVAVRLADTTELRGQVVGVDPVTDLAVIQVSSPRLSDKNVIALGDSDTVKVGAWALALGSPYGFEHTLTIGIISAVQRELDEEEGEYPDLIQTDAAINKGNSGGPLLDVQGRIIGINAAIASPTGGSIGLGFAIPINTAKAILNDLISSGRVVRGWLGAGIQEMTPVLREYYGVKQGVLVSSVDSRGPASAAGIAGEDIIVAANGTAVTDVRQLQRTVASVPPGNSLALVVMRNGSRLPMQVKVGISPSTPKGAPAAPVPSKGAGIRVRTLSSDLADRLGLDGVKGVLVIDVTPGSPGEAAGLEEGDVVVSMSRRPTASDKEFMGMMDDLLPGGIAVMKVLRDGSPRFIGIRME